MSIKGTVKNGVVVLPPEVQLPDGLQVQLSVPGHVDAVVQQRLISGAEFAGLWNSRTRLDTATAESVAQSIADISG